MESKQEQTSLALPQVIQLGEVLYKSGYFSDIKSASQAVVKIMRGQELGIGPVTALEQIHVVQGKTALGASLIAALIKKSGRYNYRVVRHTSQVCEIAFFENGQEVGRSVFTIQDAEQAGLTKKELWQKYPRNFLFARALTNGARWYCPDVFGGAVYTPEELAEVSTIDVEGAMVEDQPELPSPPPEKSNGSNDMKEVLAAVNKALRDKYDNDTIAQAMRIVLGVESRKDVPAEKWHQIRGNIDEFVHAVRAVCEGLVDQDNIFQDENAATAGA